MREQAEKSGAPTFCIGDGRLLIELAWPGGAMQKGARFDLTGHVVQATLDGVHTFCAPEDFDENRGSGGLGLCNEFWDFSGALYGSAEVGGQFPKMGVGLLTRQTEGPCNLMVPHEKAVFPIDVSASGRAASFVVHPVECNGYAARIEKTLSVEQNSLLIDYSFENAGGKPIEIREYNHNFVCIDGHPVGPDYRLRLPYPADMAEQPEILELDGREITWKGIPGGAFYCRPRAAAMPRPHIWELVHTPSGVGMREIDDFPADGLALWGKRHVVSPEVFFHIGLEPGGRLSWRRRYEFFTA